MNYGTRVYLISFLSLAAVLLTVLISYKVNAAPVMVDNYQGADSDDSTTWGKNQIRGQLWTASANYKITAISIFIRRIGNPGDLYLMIKNADYGKLSNDDLAEVSKISSQIPTTNSWVQFTIPGNILITKGRMYWWAVYAASGDIKSNYYALRCSANGGYAAGYVVDIKGLYTEYHSDYDDIFKIYGELLPTNQPAEPSKQETPPTNTMFNIIIALIICSAVALIIWQIVEHNKR